MTEPTSADWMHNPGAWRVAQTCEDNMRRFERAMYDLMTATGVSAEEAGDIAARLLAANVGIAEQVAKAEYDARELGPCVGSDDFLMW